MSDISKSLTSDDFLPWWRFRREFEFVLREPRSRLKMPSAQAWLAWMRNWLWNGLLNMLLALLLMVLSSSIEWELALLFGIVAGLFNATVPRLSRALTRRCLKIGKHKIHYIDPGREDAVDLSHMYSLTARPAKGGFVLLVAHGTADRQYQVRIPGSTKVEAALAFLEKRGVRIQREQPISEIIPENTPIRSGIAN